MSNEPANNPYLIGTNLGMSNWHHKRGRGGDETVHWPHLGEWEPIFAVTQVYNSPACLHRKWLIQQKCVNSQPKGGFMGKKSISWLLGSGSVLHTYIKEVTGSHVAEYLTLSFLKSLQHLIIHAAVPGFKVRCWYPSHLTVKVHKPPTFNEKSKQKIFQRKLKDTIYWNVISSRSEANCVVKVT